MNALAVIAMSPNNQLLGCLVMGIGIGILVTRSYDEVRQGLAARRLRRNVVEFTFGPEEHRYLLNLRADKSPGQRDNDYGYRDQP